MLAERALNRLQAGDPGDDHKGSQACPSGYFDDQTCMLHPDDIIPFLDTIVTHGPPLGVKLNFSKTKLLTTTTSISVHQGTTPRCKTLQTVLHYITSHAPQDLQTTLNPEITTGTRLLGQPIGAKTFCADYLHKAACKYTNNLHQVQAQLSDHHSKFLLFRACSQPSITHLLSADFFLNAPFVPPPDLQLHTWSSPFISIIQEANKNFLAHLADTDPTTIHDSPLPPS
jgi:hypothetical protein